MLHRFDFVPIIQHRFEIIHLWKVENIFLLFQQIYSHLGYNFKPLDIQAAIGRVQLKRLPAFIEARKQNWEYLRNGLLDLEDYFVVEQ